MLIVETWQTPVMPAPGFGYFHVACWEEHQKHVRHSAGYEFSTREQSERNVAYGTRCDECGEPLLPPLFEQLHREGRVIVRNPDNGQVFEVLHEKRHGLHCYSIVMDGRIVPGKKGLILENERVLDWLAGLEALQEIEQ